MNRLNLFEGAAMGAAAVYLFDPEKGRERRHELAARTARVARAAYRAAAEGIRRRGEPRVTAVLRPIDPRHFLRRGRSQVSAWDAPMATVDIDIDQGTVTLRGLFPPPEETEAEPGRLRRLVKPSIDVVGGETDLLV